MCIGRGGEARVEIEALVGVALFRWEGRFGIEATRLNDEYLAPCR